MILPKVIDEDAVPDMVKCDTPALIEVPQKLNKIEADAIDNSLNNAVRIPSGMPLFP